MVHKCDLAHIPGQKVVIIDIAFSNYRWWQTGKEASGQEVSTLLSFRAGMHGQQFVALTSDNALHVLTANGDGLHPSL